ncbi:hypothetical protein LTR08_001469 [Meristemomyces frigidus]|nr:hypothetical protein LTR08_001469 [Meristemomyces frigidus]
MSTFEEQSQLLDHLQTEVNRVLEQTGRLFAAANGGSKSAPAAQASKLKKELPGSINRFHDALDQLEDELQLAKAVMRRDLVTCREKASPLPSNAVAHNPSMSGLAKTKVDAAINSKPTNPDQGSSLEGFVKPKPSEVKVHPTGTSPRGDDVEKLEPEQTDQSVDQRVDMTQLVVESGPSTAPEEDNSQASDPALQVDTKKNAKADLMDDIQLAPEDDQAPGTGTYSNNADLDSLFNDPTSAVDAVNAAAAPDFDMGADAAASFDFDHFNTNLDNAAADNDNISALLPGLQDYANTQPVGSAEPDFAALFATEAPVNGVGEEAGDLQGSGEHRDSTFDDLMDFNDFNAGDYAGNEEDGSGGDQGFDFTFD